MNRSTGIILGVLIAFASSVAATGSTPPGLPWVTATKQSKIKTNPSSSAAADASLLLDASSAGAGECMIGVDTATDVCLIDAEGDAAAASMAVVGTSSAATISATTALTLEETGAGTDAITLQAPASITAPYTLELPPDAGGAGECLQNTGTPGVLDFGACAAGAGDITAVGSVASGAAFTSSATADNQCFGLTNDCSGATVAGRVEFDDQTTDEVNILSAAVGINTSTPNAGSSLDVVGLSTINDPVVNMGTTGATDSNSVQLKNGSGTLSFFVAGGASGFVPDTSQGDGGVRVDPDQDMFLGDSGKSRFMCEADGDCGIVTTAPAASLHVSKSQNSRTAIRVQNANGGSAAHAAIDILSDGADGAYIYVPSSTYAESTIRNDLVFQIASTDDFVWSKSNGGYAELARLANGGDMTFAADVAVNGGDISTTAATMNLIPSAATAINIGTTSSSAINVGDSTSYTAVSGFRSKVREVSGTVTLDGNDKNVICDSTGGTATVTMPSAANAGQELLVVRKSNDANNCNVSRAGSDSIQLREAPGSPQTSVSLGAATMETLRCFADGGTNWYCETGP